MVGLDVTHQAILGGEMEGRLRAAGAVGAFVADLNVFFTRYHRETYGWEGAPIHDAVALASVVRPGLVETRYRNVEVELESELCRGRTVVDLWNRTDRPPNAHVGVSVDAERFLELLVQRMASLG
jgi:inosine-uridine nucleoside N-ribohydrolase